MEYRLRTPSIIIVLGLLYGLSSAHPPDEHGQHGTEEHVHPCQEKELPPAFVLPSMEGPRPWSAKPFLNDPQRFHIAIMTDRTGGHRPGIWMKGVRAVNLMRPEFVVSVGDLIEGYTRDEKEIQKQWKEFLGFVEKLEMKFFFVAGNHDVTNPLMHRIWRKHFGKEYYSFDYKGVHFLCLLSEDPSTKIGDEQLEWIEKDLQANADARWTLVFMHKPLWLSAERAIAAGNADPTNWKKVEKMLGKRPHTVFSGHVHHYVQYDRNGNKYYHLATTGGGSRLRGKSYGEFDQITWLTMEKDGPRVANLVLDGVLPPDAVTEKGIRRFREFLAKSSIRIDPILVETGNELSQGVIKVRVQNEFDAAVTYRGQIEGLPLRGLTVDQSKIEVKADAGKSTQVDIPFKLAEPVHFRHFTKTALTAKLRSDGKVPLTAELTVPVIIDRRFRSRPLVVKLDGELQEWSGELHEMSKTPVLLGAAGQWQGHKDASLRFRVGHDGNRLYLGGDVTDEKSTERDGIIFDFDFRPFRQRVDNPRLGASSYRLEIAAPGEGKPAAARLRPQQGGRPVPVKIESSRKENGYQFEVSVPLEQFGQAGDWKSFQLRAVLRDVDGEEDRDTFLLWRGSRDSRSNTNYAHIFRGEND